MIVQRSVARYPLSAGGRRERIPGRTVRRCRGRAARRHSIVAVHCQICARIPRRHVGHCGTPEDVVSPEHRHEQRLCVVPRPVGGSRRDNPRFNRARRARPARGSPRKLPTTGARRSRAGPGRHPLSKDSACGGRSTVRGPRRLCRAAASPAAYPWLNRARSRRAKRCSDNALTPPYRGHPDAAVFRAVRQVPVRAALRLSHINSVGMAARTRAPVRRRWSGSARPLLRGLPRRPGPRGDPLPP